MPTRRLTDNLELAARERAVAEIAVESSRASQEHILRRVIVAVAVAITISVAGSGVGWYLVDQETSERTEAIQASRIDVLTESCEETNRRNLGSIKKLEGLAPRRPTAREQARLESSKLLIAALVPYREDCRAYARDRLNR